MRFFRPNYLAKLISAWIPALDGVEQQLSDVLKQAGFSRVRRATETPFNLVIEARP
jgi:hypothetical protein